jgi:hypothetical protein
MYSSTAITDPDRFFRFSFLHTFGKNFWAGDQAVTSPIPTQRTHTQTSMRRVAFEPTIPAFETAKTVHALDRAATVTGIH